MSWQYIYSSKMLTDAADASMLEKFFLIFFAILQCFMNFLIRLLKGLTPARPLSWVCWADYALKIKRFEFFEIY